MINCIKIVLFCAIAQYLKHLALHPINIKIEKYFEQSLNCPLSSCSVCSLRAVLLPI